MYEQVYATVWSLYGENSKEFIIQVCTFKYANTEYSYQDIEDFVNEALEEIEFNFNNHG